MKKRIFTIIVVLVFLTGVGLIAYPTFSDWWNSIHQSHAVATYVESVNNLSNEEYERMWKEAQAYNEELKERDRMSFILTEEEQKVYNSLLDVTGTGIMGYVDIPKLDVTLPIYHGTDEAVLQIAIGHIAGTSLPVGDDGTHCVISGHRGLPRAKLFTDLNKMEIGDVFTLHVLDSVLFYEVDKISIVLPDELENLAAEPDKDLCTLVTCTPYGVNSHRLLVRGHRTEPRDLGGVRVTTDALQVNKPLVAVFIAVPLLILAAVIVLIVTIVRYRKRDKKQ